MLGCAGHFIPKLRACDKGKHLMRRKGLMKGRDEREVEGGGDDPGTKLTFL